MPRPRKFRRVLYMPKYNSFGPLDNKEDINCEIIMSVEEVESMRLMDLEGLDQVECAKIMDIARSTFQRIYSEAKTKVADSLVNGKILKIQGGNYTLNKCKVICDSCGHIWEESFENVNTSIVKCPDCNSEMDLRCNHDNAGCGRCRRRRGNQWK